MSFQISKVNNRIPVVRSNKQYVNRSRFSNSAITPPYSRHNFMSVLLSKIIQIMKAASIESKVTWNRSIWLRPDISRESKARALERMWMNIE